MYAVYLAEIVGKLLKITVIFAILAMIFSGKAFAEEIKKPVNIPVFTGSVAGVYYPTGGAICNILNKNYNNAGIRCMVQSTNGSVSNVRKLEAQPNSLAIVQEDVLYAESISNTEFSRSIRALFTLFSEALTFVVKKESNINNFQDLKGKRVAIGVEGSGSRAMTKKILSMYNMTIDDIIDISDIKVSENSEALCDGEVDAYIFTFAHPNNIIEKTARNCDIKIISIENDVLEKLGESRKYISSYTIPGGLYPGVSSAVKTLGVSAILVTTNSIDDEVAYKIVSNIFDNFSNFKHLHPILENLQPEALKDQDIAAVHPGAIKYFNQK